MTQPEKRTLTHCMDIDNWISKVSPQAFLPLPMTRRILLTDGLRFQVYIMRPLRKRQRQDICKWIQCKRPQAICRCLCWTFSDRSLATTDRAFETKQKIFERGESADKDVFYMIFSGTVAVLTPPRSPPRMAAPPEGQPQPKLVAGAAATASGGSQSARDPRLADLPPKRPNHMRYLVR